MMYHVLKEFRMCSLLGTEGLHMDYKKIIIEMLSVADERRLRLIYVYVRAILGLK